MRKPCRCLLAEAQPDLAQTVQQYIASLPPDSLADEVTRQNRLACCTACAHLVDGTCTLCGCYVEARAAKKDMGCPDVPDRWR